MPSPERHITAAHIARLWERMAQIYGHKWTTHFGAADSGDTWLRGLQDLTPALLGRGIEACIHRAEEWPPNLPEFRALALDLPSRAQIIAAVEACAAGCHWRADPRALPFARAILRRLGSWDLDHMSAKDLRSAVDGVLPAALTEESQARIAQAVAALPSAEARKELAHDD